MIEAWLREDERDGGDSMTIRDIAVAPHPEGGLLAPGQTTSRRKHLPMAVRPDPTTAHAE